MGYLTHYFASDRTLDRARRWLLEAGFEVSQIEAIHQGIPRISIRLNAGQRAVGKLVIDAAEMADPSGFPGIWDLAQLKFVHDRAVTVPERTVPPGAAPATFALGYHYLDERPETGSSLAAIAMREAYVDRHSY